MPKMTPDDIARLLQQGGSGASVNEPDEEVPNEDGLVAGAQSARTQLLSDVLTACKQALELNSEELCLYLEKLADGSRDGKAVFVTHHPLEASCWYPAYGV